MDARNGDNHDAVADATAWIADATRRLAELDGGSDGVEPTAPWSEGGSALEQLRTAVAHRIAALPRRGKPIDTAIPGITVSHLALAKALTSNLAELAAEASAAIAAVDVNVAGQAVTAIRINLVAVGAADRDSTYIDDGDHCGSELPQWSPTSLVSSHRTSPSPGRTSSCRPTRRPW